MSKKNCLLFANNYFLFNLLCVNRYSLLISQYKNDGVIDNFAVMWSFFSRDPTKDFAYEIGDKVSGLEDRSLWILHQGKRKVCG